jgi:hypothetical protein
MQNQPLRPWQENRSLPQQAKMEQMQLSQAQTQEPAEHSQQVRQQNAHWCDGSEDEQQPAGRGPTSPTSLNMFGRFLKDSPVVPWGRVTGEEPRGGGRGSGAGDRGREAGAGTGTAMSSLQQSICVRCSSYSLQNVSVHSVMCDAAGQQQDKPQQEGPPPENPPASGNNSFLRQLIQEVEVLGRCQHPNVVRLLAACLEPPGVCLVMELMETSLETYLYKGGQGEAGGEAGLAGNGGGGAGGGTRRPAGRLMPLEKVRCARIWAPPYLLASCGTAHQHEVRLRAEEMGSPHLPPASGKKILAVSASVSVRPAWAGTPLPRYLSPPLSF